MRLLISRRSWQPCRQFACDLEGRAIREEFLGPVILGVQKVSDYPGIELLCVFEDRLVRDAVDPVLAAKVFLDKEFGVRLTDAIAAYGSPWGDRFEIHDNAPPPNEGDRFESVPQKP